MADAAAASSTSSSGVSGVEDANLDLSKLFDSSTDDKRNSLSIYCPRCPSLILRPSHAQYVNVGSWPLPDMQVQLNSKHQPIVSNHIPVYQHFWSVADIFTFENVGYTNTVDGRYKYLTCADCECGPLGVQVISDEGLASGCLLKKNYSYVALARVSHRD